MRKLLTLLLILSLTLTSISFVFALGTKKFPDLSDNHWAAEAIYDLVDRGVIIGYNDDNFKPLEPIQRDQFIKMVIVAMGMHFSLEQDNNYWAKPYIDKAIAINLIDNNEFYVYNVPMTREEMAKVIVNALLRSDPEPSPNLDRFIKEEMKDYSNVKDKYKDAVIHSYGLGLITGYGDGEFKPQNVLNRAEASLIVMRYIDSSLRKQFEPDIDPKYVIEMLDWNFQPVKVYPPSKLEVIDTARLLIEAAKKTKGYQDTLFGSSQDIRAGFYENKEKRDELYKDPFKNIYNNHMSISIHTLDYPQSMKYAYMISVFNREMTKELHQKVVEDFLNYLFEDEADKVIQKFNTYMEYDVAFSTNETIKYNNREASFLKVTGNDSFQIVITSKLD